MKERAKKKATGETKFLKKNWEELTDDELEQLTEDELSELMIENLVNPKTGLIEIGQ